MTHRKKEPREFALFRLDRRTTRVTRTGTAARHAKTRLEVTRVTFGIPAGAVVPCRPGDATARGRLGMLDAKTSAMIRPYCPQCKGPRVPSHFA